MTEKLTHRVARCNSTAELMDANMQVIPGVTLLCELEAGHDDAARMARECCGGRPEDHPATEHALTLRWHDVTVDELAEVLDPDESFDLEVDIADEAVLEQQQQAAVDNGEPVDERDYHQCPTCRGLVCTCSDAVPEAARRCHTCGRKIERVHPSMGTGWRHAEGGTNHYAYPIH